MADLTELYRSLEGSTYVRSVEDGTPLPLVSPRHTDGVIVPVYGDLDTAAIRAGELSSSYGVEAVTADVSPLWDTLQRFAQLGFAGVMLNECYFVHFFNRIAEPDRQLPSVARLRAQDSGEGEVFFGPSGIIQSRRGTDREMGGLLPSSPQPSVIPGH